MLKISPRYPPKIPQNKWKPGCPQPLKNGVVVSVVDKIYKNHRYGFVLLLEVSESVKEPYSIVHEYPDGSFGANFQTWNLNYFGFYEKFVLFHSKQSSTPGDNIKRHALVVENMEIDSIRM